MNQVQQPDALQLADMLEALGWRAVDKDLCKAGAELRRLHARNAWLEAELVKESFRTARETNRADQMSLQHDTQAALNREARTLLAANALQSEELERDHSDEDAAIAAGKVQAAVQGRVGMKTDRELLEMAAKAAGLKALRSPDGILRNCTGFDPAMNIFAAPPWNPLTDDGDCARMEAALGIDVLWTSASVIADHDSLLDCMIEPFNPHGGDKQAARRMASLHVAAEIGKSMQLDLSGFRRTT